MSFAPFSRKPLRRFDVSGLRALVASAKQNDHCFAPPLKIDSITRTKVNTQFTNPISYGRRVACMSIRETIQAGGYQCPRALIFELSAPFAERFGLSKLEHNTLYF
jgi:hypothetical protein